MTEVAKDMFSGLESAINGKVKTPAKNSLYGFEMREPDNRRGA